MYNTILRVKQKISIHAPHEGERLVHIVLIPMKTYFNPRSPRGGATLVLGVRVWAKRYFNPRSPRGGATERHEYDRDAVRISIHAPHEGERRSATSRKCRCSKAFQSTLPTRGSDSTEIMVWSLENKFQSTLPTRGSDMYQRFQTICHYNISIHAPHEGERRCDNCKTLYIQQYFNPRSPRGGATPVSSPKQYH